MGGFYLKIHLSVTLCPILATAGFCQLPSDSANIRGLLSPSYTDGGARVLLCGLVRPKPLGVTRRETILLSF